MVEYIDDKLLSKLLKAMSDTTRRALLTQLCQQGPSRVTDLANFYDMSLNAISKHIKVLEKAELVRRKTMGRSHWIEVDLNKIAMVDNWLNGLKSIWQLRLDKLDELMKTGDAEMTDLTVNVSRTIHAPIERVFDAWLNPKTLSQFILPMPGMPEPQTQTDAQEGGGFTIIMQVGDEKIPHTGKYLEISRPDKLVFTWMSPYSVDNSIVTINFSSIDGSKTSVELTHVKFIDEETRSDHEGGWSNILDKLNDIMCEY